MILHLFHPPAQPTSTTSLALLSAGLNLPQCSSTGVWLLGGSELKKQALTMGIDRATLLGVPWGQAMMGWPMVRYHLQQLEHEPTLIHTWSLGSLTLAMMLRPRVPRVLTVAQPMSPGQVHALRFLLSDERAPSALLCTSHTLQRDLLAGGVPASFVHVLHPGIDLGWVQHAQQAELRKIWGVPPVSPKSSGSSEPSVNKPIVVGLLADPVWSVDARRLLLVIGLADEALRSQGFKLHVLVHPQQQHLPRARRTLAELNKGYQFIIDAKADEPWAVLPGCDIALAMGPGAGGLSTRWGMAGNLPIIGEATYAQCEVLEDRHSALLAKPGDAVQLARRIAQAVTDTTLAWQLRDTARHEAFSYFSKLRYGQSLQKVYVQLIAGHRVEVPAMTSTGGLRFEAAM